jgi:hypothetical protein
VLCTLDCEPFLATYTRARNVVFSLQAMQTNI